MVDLQPPAFDELARLAGSTKPIRFELDQRGEGEGVVAGNKINVAMADAGHPERALPSIIARDVMNHRARIMPLRIIRQRTRIAAHDEHGRMPEVIGALS